MLSTLLLLALLVLGSLLIKMQREQERLQKKLRRYESLSSKEEQERQLASNIDKLLSEQERLNIQVRSLQGKLSGLTEEDYLLSLGFYEPKYDFISSDDYQRRFDQVTSDRKKMVKNKTAAVCYSHKEWTVAGDEKKGKQFIVNYLNLIRGTFDTICESAISEAKTSNINKLEKRIKSNFEKLNKLSDIIQCKITEEYLKIRLIELDIKYEMEAKKQEERERDKLIREQLAQEKKQREAIEKARQEAEEAEQREKQYQEEREKIRQEMTQAVGQQLEELERKNGQLDRLIAKAQADKKDANLRTINLKSGCIYVISSMGLLEEDIYRICMTQRDDPDRYIREMNPVVPFPFEIHFKVYSEDVSDTLKRLHQRFHNRRVNKVNERREFFRVSKDEIARAINEIANETGVLKNIQRFDVIPLENEYLRTRAIERKDNQSSSFSTNYREDETA